MRQLKKLQQYINKMYWPMLMVGVKTISVGLVNKFFAIFLGPAAFGVLGNYINMFQILFNPTAGALNNTVLKYVDRDSDKINTQAVSAVFYLSVCLNVCVVLFYFSTQFLWSQFELEISSYWVVVLCLACVFQPLMTFFGAYLNGLGKTKQFVIFSILYSLLNMAATLALTCFYGFPGAIGSLIANAFFASVLGGFGFFNLSLKYVKWVPWTSEQSIACRKYFGYLLISIVSAVLAPMVQMAIRRIISINIDLDSVGYWQGLQRVSELYMSVVLSVITLMYLPEMSTAKSGEDVSRAFSKGLRTVVPTGLIVALISILFSPVILRILLSEAFVPVAGVARIYFAADLFRTLALLGSYYFVARAHHKIFIFSELAFSVTQLVFYYVLTKKYGFDGVAYAQVANGIIYCIFCFSVVSLLKRRS